MSGDKINKLIEKFIEFKNNKGLTDNQLSEISGVSLARVKEMFNGKIKHPTFYEIVNIAVALKIPTDEIDKIFSRLEKEVSNERIGK